MTMETKANKRHHLNNKQLCNDNHFAIISSFISTYLARHVTIERNTADINIFRTKSYCKCL